MSLAGERIRTARQLLGITQEDLGDAVGKSAQQISAIENGTRHASAELIATVARATALPSSFFDAVPPDIPPDSLRFRKLASASRVDTKRAQVLLHEALRVLLKLLIDVNNPAPRLPIAYDTPDGDEIERLADETRLVLGLGEDGPVRHLTRACERNGIAVAPLVLPGDDVGEAVGHFGASCWTGGDDPALIGYFVGGPGDRQRLTLAHEVGHLVLHSRRRYVEEPEKEANRFAGALLVPRARMEEAWAHAPLTLRDLRGMKAHWGVSIQALIMRSAQVGMIDEARKTSLFKQLSARGWRKNEPVVVHPEEPILIRRLLAEKFGEKGMYQKACEPLGMGAMILRSFAPPAA